MVEWVFKPESLDQNGVWKESSQEFLKYIEKKCGKYQLTLGVFQQKNEFHVVGHMLWSGKEFHKIIVSETIEQGFTILFEVLAEFIQSRQVKKKNGSTDN